MSIQYLFCELSDVYFGPSKLTWDGNGTPTIVITFRSVRFGHYPTLTEIGFSIYNPIIFLYSLYIFSNLKIRSSRQLRDISIAIRQQGSRQKLIGCKCYTRIVF